MQQRFLNPIGGLREPYRMDINGYVDLQSTPFCTALLDQTRTPTVVLHVVARVPYVLLVVVAQHIHMITLCGLQKIIISSASKWNAGARTHHTHTHAHALRVILLPIAGAMIANKLCLFKIHRNLCWDYTIQQLAGLIATIILLRPGLDHTAQEKWLFLASESLCFIFSHARTHTHAHHTTYSGMHWRLVTTQENERRTRRRKRRNTGYMYVCDHNRRELNPQPLDWKSTAHTQ